MKIYPSLICLETGECFREFKSPYSDRIKNEMIKSSLNELMPVYLQLFNKAFSSGTIPQNWCDGLITPIFKTGSKTDPSNYRGICISSCLGKLFCSILNQRLLEHVQSHNILHKSQIGFLAKNRTADHVFTLRTLVDKYVKSHQTKLYACFVDFRKAFDSVWHDGLMYKFYKSMSEEAFIKLSKVYTRILRVLLQLEIVKRDLFNTVEVCVKAAF